MTVTVLPVTEVRTVGRDTLADEATLARVVNELLDALGARVEREDRLAVSNIDVFTDADLTLDAAVHLTATVRTRPRLLPIVELAPLIADLSPADRFLRNLPAPDAPVCGAEPPPDERRAIELYEAVGVTCCYLPPHPAQAGHVALHTSVVALRLRTTADRPAAYGANPLDSDGLSTHGWLSTRRLGQVVPG